MTPLRTYVFLCSIWMMSSAWLAANTFTHVVIDPGHGGKDKGAIWGGVRESDLNLKVAHKVANLLRAHGIPVTMTRSSDQWVSLTRRASISNRYRNTLFVSIHFNASTHTYVRGVETYYASANGRRLAESIQSQMVQTLGLKNRKTRLGGQYAVLNKTSCTAVLVECGYISNYSERKKCKRSWYQSLAASAITSGILAYR
ncbi:N-acetylmuramoyl-L-alanine amidase [Rubritalea tangerina]|uniref:N-acetylmuramoyl-L-alanine amidase n=1 Tax=Rubritalea tangerina TaxID=430798 RepID=A0ABW4ZD99_9BACT